MAKVGRGSLAMICAWGLSGCGGDDSIPLADLGAKIIDVTCRVAVRCGTYPDQATCTAANRVEVDQMTASVNAGRVKYSGSAAFDCFEAIDSGAWIGSCSLSAQVNGEPPPPCMNIFKGTVADGGPCFTSDECASTRCDRTACTGGGTTCCAGACSPTGPDRIPVGGDCSAANASCVDGAFCRDTRTFDPTTGIGVSVCAMKIAAGQPCDALNGFEQCAAGTMCLFDNATVSLDTLGVCARLPVEGQPCNTFGLFDCDERRDYCEPTTSMCTRRTPVGEACPASGDTCAVYAICAPDTMTCAARGALGDSCGALSAGACLGSLACENGTCAERPPTPACS